MGNKYINNDVKTAITDYWKSDSCCLFKIERGSGCGGPLVGCGLKFSYFVGSL